MVPEIKVTNRAIGDNPDNENEGQSCLNGDSEDIALTEDNQQKLEAEHLAAREKTHRATSAESKDWQP